MNMESFESGTTAVIYGKTLYQITHISFRRIIPMLDYTRIPKNDRMRWNISVYEGIGTNNHIITHRYFPNNRRIYTNTYATSNRRNSLSGAPTLHTNGNTLMDITIRTQDCIPVNSNIIKMADI